MAVRPERGALTYGNPMTPTNELPGLDEAIALTVEYLRAVIERPPGHRGDYGYDMWVPAVATAWAHKASGAEALKRESLARRASPVFFEAAWELCRRGLIRPGIRETGGQAVAGGCGYSLTILGREWLADNNDACRFVTLQPGGLADALARYRSRFGDGFFQRVQEAVRCRNAEAWVSACVMAGAAAESILLAAAVARTGNEDAVLKAYGTANGRKKLINDITNAVPQLARPFSTIAGLVAFWRDDTAHSQATVITGPEVEQVLRELLQLAQFTADNWEALTENTKAAGRRGRQSQAAQKREPAAPPAEAEAEAPEEEKPAGEADVAKTEPEALPGNDGEEPLAKEVEDQAVSEGEEQAPPDTEPLPSEETLNAESATA